MQYWSKCSLRLPALSRSTADVVQACQQRRELVEILQARHVLFAHVFALLAGHAEKLCAARHMRNTTYVGLREMRKSRWGNRDAGIRASTFRRIHSPTRVLIAAPWTPG